jgi:type IV pilus assembly protein PilV
MTRFFRFRQQGVGLIEVMVTVLILGTSLLAVAAMQSRSLLQNHGAFLATKANILAYDLMEQVRMSSSAPTAANLKIVLPVAAAVTAAIAAEIPTGTGSVACDAARLCTVTINWTENTGKIDIANANDNVFVYTTSL